MGQGREEFIQEVCLEKEYIQREIEVKEKH